MFSGGIEHARALGALTIGLTCVPASPIAQAAELAITPATGPEVVTGSTRMKAGTATKLVLNMLSTGALVRLGYVYGNLMVNVQPTNVKLRTAPPASSPPSRDSTLPRPPICFAGPGRSRPP